MAAIELEELPKEKEYEEYVSAFFQCDGYYLERNIIDRGKAEILELDIIATNYSTKIPTPILIEIKSGGWGFLDIFKMRGWLDYIKDIQQAVLIAQKDRDHIDFFIEKAKELKIDIVINKDLKKTTDCLFNYLASKRIESVDIDWWRYSYWIERQLLKWLNVKKKSAKDVKRYNALEEYYNLINSGIFFTSNILDRLESLYDTFTKYPRITAKCGNEMIGGSFDEDIKTLDQSVFKNTYYNCELNDISISTFIEHIARLTILKNCVEYILYQKAGISAKIDDEGSFFSKLYFFTWFANKWTRKNKK